MVDEFVCGTGRFMARQYFDLPTGVGMLNMVDTLVVDLSNYERKSGSNNRRFMFKSSAELCIK